MVRSKHIIPTERLPLVANGEPDYRFDHNGTQVNIIKNYLII